MHSKRVRFFMGSMSPGGFFGYFEPLLAANKQYKTVLLKAAPGGGKSTLLKNIAERIEASGGNVHYIHCASDPASLDGIISDDKRILALDATSPHALEPKYPEAREHVFSLYNHIDAAAIKMQAAHIETLFDSISKNYERSSRYISAAAALINDTARVAGCFTDVAKAKRYGEKLALQHAVAQQGESGTEQLRMLSALTPQGPIFFGDTITALADDVIIIDDPYSAASRALLQAMRDRLLKQGRDIITCYCEIAPMEKIEHIFIPGDRFAILTSNTIHTCKVDGAKTIHAKRFMQPDVLKSRKKRLAFNKKAGKSLMDQAVDLMKNAKDQHDELERIYIAATDFGAYAAELEKLYAYLEI